MEEGCGQLPMRGDATMRVHRKAALYSKNAFFTFFQKGIYYRRGAARSRTACRAARAPAAAVSAELEKMRVPRHATTSAQICHRTWRAKRAFYHIHPQGWLPCIALHCSLNRGARQARHNGELDVDSFDSGPCHDHEARGGAAVALGTKLYLLRGAEAPSIFLSNMEVFDTVTGMWSGSSQQTKPSTASSGPPHRSLAKHAGACGSAQPMSLEAKVLHAEPCADVADPRRHTAKL